MKGRDLGLGRRATSRPRSTASTFPLGYHAELLGEYAERQAAQRRLLLYRGSRAAIGIFLLLQVVVRQLAAGLALSFLDPADRRWSAASSRRGSPAASISLGSLVGFFTVLGIAARNGIMLINHFQHLERYEGEPFGPDLVLRGARERLSPILMTALATGLALVPLVIAGDLPGHEIEHPMADRHPRRPGHLDAAQPVHRAGAVPAIGAGRRRARRRRDDGGRARVTAVARRLGIAGAVLALIALTGCGEDSPAPQQAASAAGRRRGLRSRVDFHDATSVDNPWFPLVPGTRMTWIRPRASTGRSELTRKVVFTVTDLVKEIEGVPTVVIWELDYTTASSRRRSLSFFAQDDAGNVWHLGEYPEEYKDGEVVKHPAWIAGFEGALPGIHMPASPALGTPSYAQGWGPPWDGTIGATPTPSASTPARRSTATTTCLVTREFSRSEPGAYQLKYYARGVGNVRVGWGGPNEEEHEVLVLTALVTLGADALAEVRADALAQEADAYRLSPAVYGATPPSKPRSSA